ncbi:hypothetical protein FW320_11585 [Azospirillum sp. Vi22]|uniref:hypothetical protein n=1 Tax=Azospirillum baldaniorum TaxID=1064539 RepID=UPI00157BB09A|nr:hypothetical protein [Azospirillum baldaniorum]NUB06814.1 hypothetical protein [Azospirillum baldaniorum]
MREKSKYVAGVAGARGGRGYRWQDLVGALAAVRAAYGQAPWQIVIPEQQEDFLLLGEHEFHVQAKSRRPDQGPFSVGAIAKHLELIHRRAGDDIKDNSHFGLWIEAEISGLNLGLGAPPPALRDALISRGYLADRATKLLEITDIEVIFDPRDAGRDLLSRALQCPPRVADELFSAVADLIRDASDANASAMPPQQVDTAMVIAAVSARLAMLDPASLQAALRSGVCEPIDFTPLADDGFYLGTDTQPAHVGADLVFARPVLEEAAVEGLARGRPVLVAGPSGTGKTALAWLTVRRTQATTTWFRVRRLDVAARAQLLALANEYMPSPTRRVGFVVDNVGADVANEWDALLRDVQGRVGIDLLGTIREEDLPQLETVRSCNIVRPRLDEGTARRIWEELRKRRQTEWAGWREPFAASGGLVLEYVHQLTTGTRLATTIEDQVARRVREGRDLELAMLRVMSVAGSAGVAIDPTALRHELGASEGDFMRASARLLDEHLLRTAADGSLVGLHELRSTALAAASHRLSTTTQALSACSAARCAIASSLRSAAARLTRIDGAFAMVARELQARFTEPAPAAADILRGLRIAAIESCAPAWTVLLAELGIRVPVHDTATILAIIGKPLDYLSAEMEMARLRWPETQQRLADLLASVLPGEEVFTAAARICRTCGEAQALLDACIGWPSIPATFVAELAPLYRSASLEEIAKAAHVVRTLAETHHNIFIAHLGGSNSLLQRVHDVRPWVINVRYDEATRHVGADLVLIEAPAEIEAAVFELAQLLLAIVPAAEQADCDAVLPTGVPMIIGGYPFATKRIRREAITCDGSVEMNRAWGAAVRRQDGATLTNYYAECLSLFDVLGSTIRRISARWATGKPPIKEDFAALMLAQLRGSAMTPPPRGNKSDGWTSSAGEPHQLIVTAIDVLFRCYDTEKEQAVAIAVTIRIDILDRLPAITSDPGWSLVDADVTPICNRIESVYASIADILFHDVNNDRRVPFQLGLRRGDGTIDGAARAARRQAEKILDSIEEKIGELAVKTEELKLNFEIHRVVDPAADRYLWPSHSILVIVDCDPINHMVQVASLLAAAAAEKIDDPLRNIVFVPRIGNALLQDGVFAKGRLPTPKPEILNRWRHTINAFIYQSTIGEVVDRYIATENMIAMIEAKDDAFGLTLRETRALAEQNVKRASAIDELMAMFTVLGFPSEVVEKFREFFPDVAQRRRDLFAAQLAMVAFATEAAEQGIDPAAAEILTALTGLRNLAINTEILKTFTAMEEELV